MTRAIRKMLVTTKEEGKDVQIFIVGEKGRSQLSRVCPDVRDHKRSTQNIFGQPYG